MNHMQIRSRTDSKTPTNAEKLSIFKSEEGRLAFLAAYDRCMQLWQAPYATIEIGTEYGRCHVIASGPKDGKPVVLLHGMTGNSAMWLHNIPALQDYRTYCIDAPGDFGRSIAERLLRTPDDCARWLDQSLTALGLPTASLIGHSMGGWLAANYAVRVPERIEKLVLLAPVATFMPVPFLKLLRRVYPSLLFPNPKRITKTWDWFCAEGNTLETTVMEQIVTAYMHCRSRLPAIPTVITESEWAKLEAPVLFMTGDQEKIFSADTAMAKVREILPSARVHLVPNAGHGLIMEQAGLVNDEIVHFLR